MAERRGTKALELWCRRMTEGYPGVKIDNMTTSWRDGLAFCAMIHHFRPDLIDFDKLNKADVYYNNSLAFTTAEKYLGIPALLDADDMAAYEVPDRLSILTYLSQFYQVFAAQDSHNRLKRPPTSATDKTPLTKPSGPPSKMAHVVGVPRRDPCRKCKLPVFLAERLMVGEKVYHRTCLRCARCGSQLTPGSFYETEIDDQYCCETCPDEELTVMKADSATGNNCAGNTNADLRAKFESDALLLPPVTKPARNSIKERLSFFEKGEKFEKKEMELHQCSSSELLQKNVSDEEKSQSLEKKKGSPTSYKMSAAFVSFLNDAVAGSDIVDRKYEEGKMETSESEEEEEKENNGNSEEIRESPKLASTVLPSPPSKMAHEINSKDNEAYLTGSTQLILGLLMEKSSTDIQPNNNVVETQQESKQMALQLTPIVGSDESNNNTSPEKAEVLVKESPNLIETTAVELTQETKRNNIGTDNDDANNEDSRLELTQINDNDCITKDKADIEVFESIATIACQRKENSTSFDKAIDTKSLEKILNEKRTKSKLFPTVFDDKETTERLSVVRSRLQQFEVIENMRKESSNNFHQDQASNSETLNTNNPKQIPEILNDSSRIVEKIENDSGDENEKKLEIIDLNLSELNSTKEVNMKIDVTKPDNEESKHAPKLNHMEIDVPSDKEVKENNEILNSTETKIYDILVSAGAESQQKTKIDSEKYAKIANFSARSATQKKSLKVTIEDYPKDLNPFMSEDEDENENENENGGEDDDGDDEEENDDRSVNNENLNNFSQRSSISKLSERTNPFDSSDDEIELLKSQNSSLSASITSTPKIPPPRPPPPRIQRNPFADEDGEESSSISQSFSRRSSLNISQSRKTPVPTPRTNRSQSQNPTPEATPRLSTKTSNTNNIGTISSTATTPQNLYILQNSSDFYGSVNSLLYATPNNLLRNSDLRSSNNSLNSSTSGTVRSRKTRRAPLPPAPVKELFPSNETINSSSKASTPASSTVGTPKSGRKKRPAPAPPKPARLEAQLKVDFELKSKNLLSYPLQSELDSKLSDEEKALLEGKTLSSLKNNDSELCVALSSRQSSKRLIPLDKELLEEHGQSAHGEQNQQQQIASQSDDFKERHQKQTIHPESELEETNVVYRRLLIPSDLDTPPRETNPLIEHLNRTSSMGERQMEKLKDNKEAKNRNRQSQISGASSGAEDSDPLFNKSIHGKWKRRKGPAPALPIPPRRVLQMLPLQEIKHELEIIEVQQQGLEKQGVILEKMIRDRCEGQNDVPSNTNSTKLAEENAKDAEPTSSPENSQNSKEVEYLILQLFELVNEKNELFRRQAELMYLRRQHRLEQEQADLEYEIRVLMAQPERNKTDTDKAREEALIERLVEVVQLRNEVVDCLEMDRIREIEEDQSIKQRLESHIAKRDEDEIDSKKSTNVKLSKKEKKKQKEAKKVSKSKKIDADKDADESEITLDKQKIKKKKKIFLF
ncbi:MICAL-like protein isoform 1-T6 [Glossina fuscipes fuscipes]